MNRSLDPETETVASETPLVESAQRQRAVRRLLRAEVIYVAALTVFALLALFAYLNPYFGWDLSFSTRFNWQRFTPPGLLDLMLFLSLLGNSWIPYVISGITAIIFLIFKLRSEAVALILSTAGGALINMFLKMLIARPRPTADLIPIFRDVNKQSFPSGHVTFYVCYFGFLFFVAYALLPRGSAARRLALVFTSVPVLLIGLSRVYLGAHWPSDTIGGYLWSGVWLALVLWIYRRWKQRKTFHRKDYTGTDGARDW